MLIDCRSAYKHRVVFIMCIVFRNTKCQRALRQNFHLGQATTSVKRESDKDRSEKNWRFTSIVASACWQIKWMTESGSNTGIVVQNEDKNYRRMKDEISG